MPAIDSKHLRIACLFAVCLLGSGRPALGLGVLADDRWAYDNLGHGAGAEFLAPFSVQFTGAGQESWIRVSADGLGLDGAARGRASGFFGYHCLMNGEYQWCLSAGTSLFSISFRIDGEGELSLEGNLVDGPFEHNLLVRVLSGDEVLYVETGPTAGIDPFSLVATLEPGEYRLEARADTGGGWDLAPTFDLTFHVRDSAVPIPEPGTALTFGLGLAGIATARARQPA